MDAAWKEAEKAISFEARFGSGIYWARLALLKIYSGDYQAGLSLAERTLPQYSLAMRSMAFSLQRECSAAETLVDTVLQVSQGFIQILVLYPLAVCQLEVGQYDEASKSVRRLQNLYDNAYGYWATYYPKSLYLLGKIYEAQGEIRPALENYEQFLDIWENADEDLPELIDAKMRYERLKTSLGS